MMKLSRKKQLKIKSHKCPYHKNLHQSLKQVPRYTHQLKTLSKPKTLLSLKKSKIRRTHTMDQQVQTQKNINNTFNSQEYQQQKLINHIQSKPTYLRNNLQYYQQIIGKKNQERFNKYQSFVSYDKNLKINNISQSQYRWDKFSRSNQPQQQYSAIRQQLRKIKLIKEKYRRLYNYEL